MLHHSTHFEKRKLKKQMSGLNKVKSIQWIAFKCKCKAPLRIKKPAYLASAKHKSYTVCSVCNLHWHLDLEDNLYSHIWKLHGKDVHFLKIKKKDIKGDHKVNIDLRKLKGSSPIESDH